MDADRQRAERLRTALDELAAADAPELLAEARAEARTRVRQVLSDALAQATLDAVTRQLGDPKAAPAAPERPATGTAPAPPARAPGPERDELGWYVYGVIASDSAPQWTLAGMDRAHPVSTVHEDNLAAVVSRVPLQDFAEDRLREHLADMGWVEATARAHEDVLEQTRAQVTVIPMRMCTVYRSESGVREMLQRESEALAKALSHLQGRTEVGVKVFADRRQAQFALRPEGSQADPAGSGQGAAYMERRRHERDREDALDELLEEKAAEIHERMCGIAVEGLVVPPQRPEASGHQGAMILNGVYLVEDDALDAFRSELSALRDTHASAGLELEMTGPWPAYNFVPGTIGAAW